MQSVVAYMLYTLNCLTAHIAKLAVCPKHRRQGWAAALLALVLQDLQTKRRIRTFTLHVADVNVPAKALYAKAGFVEDGFLEVSVTRGFVTTAFAMMRTASLNPSRLP